MEGFLRLKNNKVHNQRDAKEAEIPYGGLIDSRNLSKFGLQLVRALVKKRFLLEISRDILCFSF